MRPLIEELAGLIYARMWKRVPDDFFYTPFTPRETDEIVLSLVKSGHIPPDAEDKNGNTLLRSTVMKINTDPGFYSEAIWILLEAGAHPDKDSLLEAVKSRSPETVKVLLEAGSEPDSDILELAVDRRNIDMMLALSRPGEILERLLYYARFGRDKDFEAADALLKAGADPSQALVNLWRLRGVYADLGALVKMLLDAGADINAVKGGRKFISDSQTILHRAVYEQAGDVDFVRMLIDRGADVNVQDRDGYTPLMSACVRESGIDIVTALLDAGAKLDTQSKHGETALFFAAGKDDLDVVKLLLDRGADPNIVNSKGDTALTRAMTKHKDSKRVCALVEHGADPGFVHADGETAFMMMAKRYCDEYLTILMTLMKYNPDTREMEEIDDADLPLDFANAQDSNGDTALIKAVRDNPCKSEAKYTAIKAILVLGADPSITNNDGKTALYYAIEDFTRGKAIDGETVLMTFARTFKQSTGVLDLLLAVIVPAPAFMVNAQDSHGDTALIKAVRDNNRKTAVTTILALGAAPNIKNNDGKRAVDYATKKDIKALLEQGGTH